MLQPKFLTAALALPILSGTAFASIPDFTEQSCTIVYNEAAEDCAHVVDYISTSTLLINCYGCAVSTTTTIGVNGVSTCNPSPTVASCAPAGSNPDCPDLKYKRRQNEIRAPDPTPALQQKRHLAPRSNGKDSAAAKPKRDDAPAAQQGNGTAAAAPAPPQDACVMHPAPCTITATTTAQFGCTVTEPAHTSYAFIECGACALTTTTARAPFAGLGPMCQGGRKTVEDETATGTVGVCAPLQS